MPQTPDRAGGLAEAVLLRTRAPAVAGAVVGRDGLIHLEFAGRRRVDRPDLVTGDDRWHIGSNGKAMSAALYARLVEAGLARWGAPLPELFPDLSLHPAWSATTIEDLLAHRTGLMDHRLRPGLSPSREDARPAAEQRAAMAAAVLAGPPAGRPGRFVYANLNYVLAGAAIERIAGAPWEAAITDRLFAPLGILSAGFGAPTGEAPWGHAKRWLRPLRPVDPADPAADNPPLLGPAGRVHLTLTDHARFIRLFLGEGDGLLSADSLQRLTRPAGGGGPFPYALGWLVLPGRPRALGPMLTHEGSNTLWHAVAMVSPGRGVGVITAANAMARGAAAARLLARRLAERFAPR